MDLFYLLAFLGVFTYFMVQRSVVGITRTPVWLLWLVMMMPALTWSVWVILNGKRSPHPLLIPSSFVISLALYIYLLQKGRLPNAPEKGASTGSTTNSESSPTQPTPSPEPSPSVLPRLINNSEESSLKTCFPWSVFYLQNLEHRPQAVICRGQLRTSADIAYQKIRENIIQQFGDRFLVLLQEGLNGKPFFAIVPNPQTQSNRRLQDELSTRPSLAIVLFLTTILTTTQAGFLLSGGSSKVLSSDPAVLWQGIPYALALMMILGVHELGHYWVARVYRLKSTLPFFIPFPWILGTFGAFTQVRSPIPDRKVLFDISVAGPLAGLLPMLGVLIWGLMHSSVVKLPEETQVFNFRAINPSWFTLLALLSKLVLGKALTDTSAIHLHPVAVAGYVGLLATAFNLLPIGQLDGGRMVHAMFGLRTSIIVGQITRIALLLLSLVFVSHRNLVLFAILLFLIPAGDEPTLNDVSEINNRRDLVGLLCLGLLFLIVLPMPRVLTEALF
jgi:membrane-associated protease RseP (regulator of RpoE activity)